MTSFKYTAATLALLLTSSLSFAANTATTTSTTAEQPAAAQSSPECPAAGTVAEADLPAECKNQATMPKQDGTTSTGSAETVQPDSSAATTTELPKQDNAATGSAVTTTEEMPKQDDAATATTEVPKQDGTAVTDTNAAATATEEMPKQDATAPAEVVASDSDVTEAKASSSVLASQFMGQTVYSAANESVGEINDIVMNRELDNVVAIIGVGGFLGIGEKDVAISIDEITAVKDENNNLKLTIAATKEQLEAAPTFDRTALK